MKEQAFTRLKNALRDQDWIEVAKVALILDQMVLENEIISMEKYYEKENEEFIAECRKRNYGNIISVGNTSDKKRMY